MMKRFYLLIPAFLLCSGFLAGQNYSKLDLRLWARLHEGNIRNHNMALLVKGDLTSIKELTKRNGGIYKYGYHNISSLEIPEKNLLSFTSDPAIEKIENTSAKGVFLMDTARIRNNIDSVHAGYAPLSTDLKGRNVIIGIIDGGIYWQHDDFKNALGDTRIRYIWDQSASPVNAPQPYMYGNEWNWMDINNGNCTHVPPSNDFGHGTCVAGIAAGNGSSLRGTAHENQFTGVAPESEIIAVRVLSGDNFLSNLTDAVDYIFKKADALGMPCVINTSVGTYYGSHDGIDLSTKIVEALLDERNGRALVAAAGNAGNLYYHLGYNIPADSAYTFFLYNPVAKEIYFDLWADTANFRNARFAIGCNTNSGAHLRRTEYFNVPADFNPHSDTGVILTRYLTNNTRFDTVRINATLDEGRYHVEFLINPSDVSNYWRLQTAGSGRFDLWSSSALIGSADMTDRLNSGVYIQYNEYRHPDSLKTMVSSWQNSDKVITVGNYSSRAGYFDYDSNYVDVTAPGYDEVVGKRFVTSSIGPTRDNRLKPDIMATGSTTLCTGDANDIALKLGNNLHYKVAIGGKHIRNGGTSMSAPVIAGIAALYFEKRPTATYDEIKQALICTAKKDAFTGATANYEYGNGKVNAFAALNAPGSCFIFGAKDTACLNYNPLANADTGGCILKVYGCTDSVALNYNPLANVEDGSCVIASIAGFTKSEFSIRAIPNPFSTQTVFSFKGISFENGVLRIYDHLGNLADEIKLSGAKPEYVYSNEKLAKGIYHFAVYADGKNMGNGKLVVE